MKIDFVAPWMFDDFIDELDALGLAFVELSDVARWLQDFGFKLPGVEIPEKDESDMLRARLDVEPSSYELTDKDYYRGVQTILNSEIAALAKVIQLSEQLAEGEPFFDNDFGPKTPDDVLGGAESMYCKGVKPQSHPDPKDVEWLRPCEYLDQGKSAVFLKGDASANEVKQGAIGNCWFIGALSVLATRDELLRGSADQVPIEFID